MPLVAAVLDSFISNIHWPVTVYPETSLKEHISVISVFLLSYQFRAHFYFPCISIGAAIAL
jgi:hypothetical protein